VSNYEVHVDVIAGLVSAGISSLCLVLLDANGIIG